MVLIFFKIFRRFFLSSFYHILASIKDFLYINLVLQAHMIMYIIYSTFFKNYIYVFVNNDIYLKRKEKKHVILTFEFNNLNDKIKLFEDLIAYTYIFIYNMSIYYISRYTCFEWLVLKIILYNQLYISHCCFCLTTCSQHYIKIL